MIPLQWEELCFAVEGSGNKADSECITSVTTDSRKITPGCLFVPLEGKNVDGHVYIAQALSQGAAACLCQHPELQQDGVVLVKDTRRALGALAKYYRQKFSIPVVGITGSVGKTTTKDMIASVLAQKYNVCKTEGNFNNDIGLPLTVFQLEPQNEVAVLEMGMNHFDEIHYLADIARPDIGVITNIGVSHIEFLGSRDGILQAKTELFDFFDEKNTAVLNREDDKLVTLEGTLPGATIWYGTDDTAAVRAENIVQQGLACMEFTLVTHEEKMRISLPAPGKHMVSNALAAATVGLLLKLTPEEIKQGLESFHPSKMRMDVIHTKNGVTIINDSYNANPVSMKASLSILAELEGRKIAILGDMYELGEDSAKMHYEVGVEVAKLKIDCLICVGTLAKELMRGAEEKGLTETYYFETRQALEAGGFPMIQQGDTVLVKASRGVELEKTVESLQEVK